MGSSKRKAPRRSPNATQKLRYPIGELALRRHELKENFLSKSKELNSMRKKLNRTNDKVQYLLAFVLMYVEASIASQLSYPMSCGALVHYNLIIINLMNYTEINAMSYFVDKSLERS